MPTIIRAVILVVQWFCHPAHGRTFCLALLVVSFQRGVLQWLRFIYGEVLDQMIILEYEICKRQRPSGRNKLQNFESMLPDTKPGFTRVKFKAGNEEWIKAPQDEILEATVEE